MKNEKIMYVGIGFLLGIILMFCIGDNRAGVDKTRNQLNEARTNQSAITSRIDKAEDTSKDIADTGERIEQSASNLETGIKDAGDIIAECQRILSEVRKRNEAKSASAKSAT